MMRTLLAAALVPLALGDYSYSFTDAPTAAPTTLTASPTATIAPTRTETYAPTRMTEAPSYAPTTDTYAPTFTGCPPLVLISDPASCPADATSLPLCDEAGLSPGDRCVSNTAICPNTPNNTALCPAVFGTARRQLLAAMPATKSFHASGGAATDARRRLQASVDEDARRRLAAPAQCVPGDPCGVYFVAPPGQPTTAGPAASACFVAGGDCTSCCGACAPKTIADGTDFSGEAECVCFEGSFDDQVSIKLSDHDDCATVVRQGDAEVTISGEEGADALYMASPEASQDYMVNPAFVIGNGGIDHLTCSGNGMKVIGEQYYQYQDTGDGGNFMACVGNGTFMRGGFDADKISCEGNDCAVFGGAGNDDIAVVNPYGPGAPYPSDIYTSVIRGDLGIDTCTYNGFKVDYDNWYYGPRPTEGYIQSGVDGCENP